MTNIQNIVRDSAGLGSPKIHDSPALCSCLGFCTRYDFPLVGLVFWIFLKDFYFMYIDVFVITKMNREKEKIEFLIVYPQS